MGKKPKPKGKALKVAFFFFWEKSILELQQSVLAHACDLILMRPYSHMCPCSCMYPYSCVCPCLYMCPCLCMWPYTHVILLTHMSCYKCLIYYMYYLLCVLLKAYHLYYLRDVHPSNYKVTAPMQATVWVTALMCITVSKGLYKHHLHWCLKYASLNTNQNSAIF